MSYNKKYINYLKSKKWKARRYAALERAKFKCQFDECFERESLNVHHKTYDRLGNEDPGDLIVLCSGHHWYADKLRKNPETEGFQTEKRLNLCSYGQKYVHRISKLLQFKSDHGYLNKKSRIRLNKLRREIEHHIYYCSNCIYL